MDWVSDTPVPALSPSQGCLLSQRDPNSRNAFVYYGVAGSIPHCLGSPLLAGRSFWAGAASLTPWLCLTAWWDGVRAGTSQAGAWLSALGMAHWLPNKLAVASAGAGGAGVVLPGSKRWNNPSSVQEHPRLSGC